MLPDERETGHKISNEEIKRRHQQQIEEQREQHRQQQIREQRDIERKKQEREG